MNLIQRRFKYINKIICLYLSMLSKKDEDLYVFGSWYGDKFADNAKYLYLFFLKKGKNAVWITKNDDVYKQLKYNNYPVAKAYSKEGRRYCRKAKYVFACTGTNDLNENWIGGSIFIDLFHGALMKKVMYDDEINSIMLTKKHKLHEALTKYPLKKYYVASSSKMQTTFVKSAFRVNDNQILQFGLPRNDCFFDGSLKRVKYSNVSYSKMIAYLPTHRNTGSTPIPVDQLLNLEEINRFCAENNILFVIKKHFYHNTETTDVNRFSNIIDLTGQTNDTQELLFNADMLITDYSSCFIDYLLLDRPVLFYAYDYERYLATDRNMYFKYEDVAPGYIVSSYDELFKKIELAVNSGYKVLERHYTVKDMFFDKENQGVVSQKYLDAVTKMTAALRSK